MYEELVKRLQIAAQWADKGLRIPPSLCLEAANVIDELSYKYQKALDDIVKLAEPPKEEHTDV